MTEKQSGGQYNDPGERIHCHHDISPVRPVGKNSAKRREKDHWNQGEGHQSGIDGRGAGLFKDVHGQGEFQSVIADQGTDLTEDEKRKIAGKQFLSGFLF